MPQSIHLLSRVTRGGRTLLSMHQRLARILLLCALAYVFLFFGIDKFLRPFPWMQWIPPEFEGLLGLSRPQWLSIFGVVEIFLGLLVLVPRRSLRRIGVGLIAAHLLAVLTQTGLLNDIGVRDTGLLLLSIGLFFLL